MITRVVTIWFRRNGDWELEYEVHTSGGECYTTGKHDPAFDVPGVIQEERK